MDLPYAMTPDGVFSHTNPGEIPYGSLSSL